ncbi:hypothetical protein ABFA07_020719 [Porites harrisoni]
MTITDNSSSRIDLVIGGFFGVNITDGGWSTASAIHAFEMALDHVNSDPNVLTNYKLKYVWRDSKCESGVAIRAMLDLINTPPHKIVFLGPGCSIATKPIAEAASYWQAVQIGYSTSSPSLSNKEKYPLYFRTSTSEIIENPARVALLKHFKWKRVALIVQQADIFELTVDDFIPMLRESNITVIATETFQNDPSSSVKYLLKKRDARIIIGLMYDGMYRKAMCTAYREQLYGSRYVWIIVGWYQDDWWTVKDVECEGKQLKEAATNVIETRPILLSTSRESTISGKTPRQLNSEYETRLGRLNISHHFSASFTYDAAWSIALMLNKSIPLLREKNKTLEGMDYGDADGAQMMRDILFRTDFWGMSGRVSFDKDGNRQSLIQITQNKRGMKHVVAQFDVRDRTLTLYNESFVWEGGRVPADAVTIIQKMSQESIYVTVVFWVLCSCGIIFCLCCLILNFIYQRNSFIRMSFPNFNNVSVMGCILFYFELFLSAYSNSIFATHNSSLCYINVCLLCSGFTLLYGGMFLKTWRVYRIRNEVAKLSTTGLLLRIGVGCLVDVIILSCWAVVDPMTIQHIVINKKIRNDDDDVIEELMINSCTCNSPKTWVMLICCLKGILLTFGVFLSWETRNVHCLQPNDSKNTGLAVYNVFMFSCLALVVMFVETYPPIEMLIERTIVFVGTTCTICLLFLPKIVYILKNSPAQVVTELK